MNKLPIHVVGIVPFREIGKRDFSISDCGMRICIAVFMSGAEATALQTLPRLPVISTSREAFGLRRVHRRCFHSPYSGFLSTRRYGSISLPTTGRVFRTSSGIFNGRPVLIFTKPQSVSARATTVAHLGNLAVSPAGSRSVCGSPIRDTAGCQPALQGLVKFFSAAQIAPRRRRSRIG
ncbi:MAG TPA: hypothetical protein VF430_04010 [Verrucomicrobiae bacterium]